MIKEYEAKIIEEDGILKDILYKCDKEKNIECNKRNCGGEFCNYTRDKRYATDFAKTKDMQVIETKIYVANKLVRTIIDYK